MFSEFGNELLEKYQKEVVSPAIPIIDYIAPKNSLKPLKTFHTALQELLEIHSKKFVSVDGIMQKLKTIKQNYTSANGSISTLLDLFFECEKIKKQTQQELLNTQNPTHFMVTKLQNIENSIDDLFKIISLLRNEHNFLFEGDEINQQLKQIQNEIEAILIDQQNEMATDDIPKMINQFEFSLQQYEIDSQIFEFIEKATLQCFSIISNEV